MPFTPYGLRRGGATIFLRKTGSMARLTQKGRWGDARTARLYVDEADLQLAAISFEAGAKAKLLAAQRLFRRLTA